MWRSCTTFERKDGKVGTVRRYEHFKPGRSRYPTRRLRLVLFARSLLSALNDRAFFIYHFVDSRLEPRRLLARLLKLFLVFKAVNLPAGGIAQPRVGVGLQHVERMDIKSALFASEVLAA